VVRGLGHRRGPCGHADHGHLATRDTYGGESERASEDIDLELGILVELWCRIETDTVGIQAAGSGGVVGIRVPMPPYAIVTARCPAGHDGSGR